MKIERSDKIVTIDISIEQAELLRKSLYTYAKKQPYESKTTAEIENIIYEAIEKAEKFMNEINNK